MCLKIDVMQRKCKNLKFGEDVNEASLSTVRPAAANHDDRAIRYLREPHARELVAVAVACLRGQGIAMRADESCCPIHLGLVQLQKILQNDPVARFVVI
jgi:hypothetical protein